MKRIYHRDLQNNNNNFKEFVIKSASNKDFNNYFTSKTGKRRRRRRRRSPAQMTGHRIFASKNQMSLSPGLGNCPADVSELQNSSIAQENTGTRGQEIGFSVTKIPIVQVQSGIIMGKMNSADDVSPLPPLGGLSEVSSLADCSTGQPVAPSVQVQRT